MPMPPASVDAVRARSAGRCEADTPACPPGPHDGHHLHHRRTRAQGGGHDPSNLLLVCHSAHRFIHDHPAVSYGAGWLTPRGTRT